MTKKFCFACLMTLMFNSHNVFSEKYPSDAGVINITLPPYNADNTGVSDVTAIINQAFSDYASTNRIFYFPKGTYLISNILQIPGSNPMNNHIEGDGVDKTIIKLKDNCLGYSNSGSPREMINFGLGVAQRFNQMVRDITFNTGTGNTEAIGLKYTSNNEGGISNVKIMSEDGNGYAGLDLAFVNENGPLFIKNVEIYGFNYGIRSQAYQNSQTFEHITLKNQKICGFYNQGQVISIRGLISENSVQAINHNGGTMTLIEASLTEGAVGINAINNAGTMYLRDISSAGYGKLVKNNSGNDVIETSVSEWTSHRAVGLSDILSDTMLNLEIKETPDAIIDPFEQWEKVPPTNGVDDSPAIQAAIDAGKSTVYFPYGRYTMRDTVYVRGNVQRILGCGTTIFTSWSGGFRVVEGISPTVVIERFRQDGGATFLTQASSRTVVLKKAMIKNLINEQGSGDLFIEDMVGGDINGFKFNKGNVWARQFNVENEGTHITNNGANLWIMGLKTERHGNLILTQNQGKTEILGFFCYTTTAPPSTQAMFVNNESSFSAVGSETTYGTNYKYFLEEIQCGVSKKLSSSALPGGGGSGHAVSFLTSTIDTCLNVGIAEKNVKSNNLDNLTVFPNPASDVINFTFNSGFSGKVTLKIFSMLGVQVLSQNITIEIGRTENYELKIQNVPSGFYILNIVGYSNPINKIIEIL